MIARLVVVAAAVVAAVAGAVAWSRRKAEQAGASRGTGAEVIAEGIEEGSAPVATADGAEAGDDLQTIKGIGAVSAERLRDIGVTTFAEIAEWSPEQLEQVSQEIKVSAERIRREDWVGQARTSAG